MATATCETCGKPTTGEVRCPDCQHPRSGQPRKAPAGSGARPSGVEVNPGWDRTILAVIVLSLVLVVVAWLV